ncbi:PREDICTED: uncharacterized protein LOC101378297 [Odobenus rosmarus divergens]|uniref:Uncharacterized protein LOC101378297 n=1 Tax=Odobenus rosmarus divergens TaxID=9708 RepID=A0A9B0H2K9_ODORO
MEYLMNKSVVVITNDRVRNKMAMPSTFHPKSIHQLPYSQTLPRRLFGRSDLECDLFRAGRLGALASRTEHAMVDGMSELDVVPPAFWNDAISVKVMYVLYSMRVSMPEAQVPLSEDSRQHGRKQQGLASPYVKREQGNVETPPSPSAATSPKRAVFMPVCVFRRPLGHGPAGPPTCSLATESCIPLAWQLLGPPGSLTSQLRVLAAGPSIGLSTSVFSVQCPPIFKVLPQQRAPAGVSAGRTRGGHLLAWPGADGPRRASFPSPITQQLCIRHPRPNCAGGGVCVLRFLSPLPAVALPGETRGGIVIAAYAAPRGSNRQPVLLPTAARPECWQLASVPLPFPPLFAHPKEEGSSREGAGRGRRRSVPRPGRRGPRPGTRSATGSPAAACSGRQ